MKTISQVAKLAGISTRTLQYYDEIGLLTPSQRTDTGYRFYDDDSLQKLQQILFFKELGFRLKDIKEIISKADYDKAAAFKRQKELLLLKRNRTDRLIQLLSRLEKGEDCMSFKEFDLSEYMEALESFKKNSTEEILKHWGSIENFDLFIQKIREDESNVAKCAIKQYGSVENYTEAMKYNLEHFSEIMEKELSKVPERITQNIDTLYQKLTADLKRDVSSAEVQYIVQDILTRMQENSSEELSEISYCNIIIDTYSSDYVKAVFDTKHGAGASDYVVKAFQYCANNAPIGSK